MNRDNHYKNPKYNYQENGYSGKHAIMLQRINGNMMPGGKSREKCESHCLSSRGELDMSAGLR